MRASRPRPSPPPSPLRIRPDEPSPSTPCRGAGSFAGDRLEHASVLPVGLEHRLRDLRVAVVTQPNFIAERGDAYARDVDPEDLEALYRCGTLLAEGGGV